MTELTKGAQEPAWPAPKRGMTVVGLPDTFAAAGRPDGFHRAAAEVFRS